MAIREHRVRYYDIDTEAEMPPSLEGPAIVHAVDTGKKYFVRDGVYKECFSAAGDLSLATGKVVKIGGVQVVGPGNSGWTPSTGVQSKAGLVADTVFTIGAVFSLSEVGALGTGLTEVRKVVAALQTALTANGTLKA